MTSESSGKLVHPRSLTRAVAVHTHEVRKKTKGPTKNQTSSPTRWLHMCVWRISLWRTKSKIISWDGSNRQDLFKGPIRLMIYRSIKFLKVKHIFTQLWLMLASNWFFCLYCHSWSNKEINFISLTFMKKWMQWVACKVSDALRSST